MFTIYIVEDDTINANSTTNHIQEYSDTNKHFVVSGFYVRTDNFESFIEDIPHISSKYNIYIIDIDLNSSINGIDIARQIRGFDFNGYIIILTSHGEFTGKVLSYNLKVINYIQKSNDAYTLYLNSTLNTIVYETGLINDNATQMIGRNIESVNVNKSQQLQSDLSKHINFTYKGASYRVNTEDILYMETHPLRRCLNIYLADTIIEYRETLTNMVDFLPENFVRCHKSYILNVNHVRKIIIESATYLAYFDFKRSCPISKRFVEKPFDLLRS